MALNFNDLPKDRPNGDTTSAGVFEKGIYPGIAKRAEMRTSAGSGNSYLVVQIAVTNEHGQTTTVFDNFFDTDKPLPRFKLAQFLRAVGVIPSGNFELKDLVKVINNRPLSVALKIEKSAGYPDKNVVDAFDAEIYYTARDNAPAAPAPASHPAENNDDLPFDMPADEGEVGDY